MASEERFQSFRRGLDSRIVNIEAFYHEDTGQHLVDWDDILEAFPNISCIMNGPNLVPRARDSRRKFIEPRCIKYHHGVALEVVVGDVFWPGAESTSLYTPPPPSIVRTATPHMQISRDSPSSHTRTDSTSSSHCTVDTTVSQSPSTNANTRPTSFSGPSYLISPPYANNGKGYGHSRNSSELDSQQFSHPAELPSPMITPSSVSSANTNGQHQWTMNTAGAMDSDRRTAVSTSSESSSYFPPWHPNSTSGNSYPQDVHDEGLHAPPPTTVSTEVVRIEQTPSSAQSNRFMQRMQSTVQSFEQYIREGQLLQAKVVQQEAESIKKEMAQYYGNLQTEVAKNTTLQNQVKEMVAVSEKMTKRILELQEAQLDTDKMMLLLQQQALDRLSLIHSKATAILTQTYELHEFPIPRLFIILPKDDITKRERIGTMFVKRFRLYFLCECGEHTRPIDVLPSSLSHDIHLARHEGYDLDRPNEFFRKYGSYVLALLQMLKYGVVAAGMVVPPLNSLKIADELAAAEAGLKAIDRDFAPRVDSAIEYLQGLTAVQEGVSKDLGNTGSTAILGDPVSIDRLEGLEGADLRHLGSFLKARDEGEVLGNLYRTVTPQGHVKWVCLDHYRESYGAAALQEFKETVELSGGNYDQRTGRVTMRLASPILARQFYTMLMSTRLVHELELTLDWNTSFEDLRILKGVMQQSNVFHLSLNLCGKTGPTSDFVYRNRRAEPIIQIMASGKIHTLNLKNTTNFLSQTKELLKTTLHIRHFDLSERISDIDDFIKLEKLIRASPMLNRLNIVVRDMDGAFDRLKSLVARHRTLSILDLQLQDGTAASVQFEPGSDKISAIGLKLIEPKATKLMKMPTVTSVAFLTKSTVFRCSTLIKFAIEEHVRLKVIEFVQLPDGAVEKLRDLERSIERYAPEMHGKVALDDNAVFAEEQATSVTVMRAEGAEVGFDYLVLDSIHRQSLIWEMTLLVVPADGTETAAKEVAEGAVVVPAIEERKSRLTILTLKASKALAMVRFEISESSQNSVALHVDDFNSSEAFQKTSPTTLTVIGAEGLDRFKELTKDATVDFSNLRTLEIGCGAQGILSTLLFFYQATTQQYPALTRLNLWDTVRASMKVFTLPLRDLDLLNHHLAEQDMHTLRNLLHFASTLSRLRLSVSSLSKAFEAVVHAARLHKQLSKVLLVMGKSRLSAQFTVDSEIVESIALRTHESELNQLLNYPNVTELDLGLVTELDRIKEIVTSVFSCFRFLRTFKMEYRWGYLLQVFSILSQEAGKLTGNCQVILREVDVDFPQRKERVFALPLELLDITSHNIDVEDVEVVARLVQASPKLQEIILSVTSVDVAQRTFDSIFQERRPMSRLSITLDGDAAAVFSLEAKTEEEVNGALTVVQIIARSELDKTLFLPQTKVERVDVIGADIDKYQAADIANAVLHHCCEVRYIRFMDLPSVVQDIAAAIENSIRRELLLGDVEQRKGLASDISDTVLSDIANNGAELAAYSVYSDNFQDELLPRGIEESISSSIVRARQGSAVEAIQLDSTDPDGVTLQINSVAFKDSNFGHLSDVRRLAIFVSPDSALIDDLISTAISTFMDLEQLEISCLSSLGMKALLAASSAALNHPSMRQIHFWYPVVSSNRMEFSRIEYKLPIKTLDLSWYPIPPADHHLLQRIPAIFPHLTELTVKVPALLPAFKDVCSRVEDLGGLELMHLHSEFGSALSIWFDPTKGGIVSVLLTSMEFQDSMLMCDVPVLKLIELTDQTLDVIGAIQAATISNLGLQSLVLKGRVNGPQLTLEIPFRKFDLGEQVINLAQLKSLQRFFMVCSQLAELHLLVDSVVDFREACTAFGSVFQKHQKLTNVRLKLKNDTEASVRYSSKDGSIASIALWIADEFVRILRPLPLVKKMVIRTKNASLWSNPVFLKYVLCDIIRLYLDLETLEIDCGITSPFESLTLLQAIVTKQVLIHDSPHLRRYRHRTSDSNTALITHDLPLKKFDLGDFFVGMKEFPSMAHLFSISPQLVDLRMCFPTCEMIDCLYTKLKETMMVFEQLKSLSLKSQDGYGISLEWRRLPFQKEIQTVQPVSTGDIEISELEVSGTEWPLCFDRRSVVKLTILPKTSLVSNSASDTSNIVHAILAMAKHKCHNVKHVVLACPVSLFYAICFSITQSLINTEKIDFHDPDDVTKATLTNRFGPGGPIQRDPRSSITVHLENISDEVYMDIFGNLLAAYSAVTTEIVDWSLTPVEEERGEEGLELRVTVSLAANTIGGEKFSEIVWDTSNVSVQRVFELMENMCRFRSIFGGGGMFAVGVKDPSFRVLWRTAHKDTLTKPPFWQPHPRPDKLLKDPEVAKLLARLLVHKATEIDIEYEALMALIPFLKTEIKRGQGGFGGRAIGAGERDDNTPFGMLKRYDVKVVESRPRPGDLEVFAKLVSRTVESAVHELIVEREYV
ncbi:hypothetical protein EC991_003042 [Linnemannia zychae]|nr:hypothetical protein EC991_003042 [Linnemannia zychae]